MAPACLLHPQIDVDPRDPSTQDLIKNGQYRPPSKQWLDPMEPISDVWPEQPSGKRVHVFVSLSCEYYPYLYSSSARYRSSSCFSIRPWQAISCCRRLDALRPPMVSGGPLKSLEPRRP